MPRSPPNAHAAAPRSARGCASARAAARTSAASSEPSGWRPGRPSAGGCPFFVDLENFTSLAEKLDPEAVRTIQSRYFEAARSAVAAYDGTIEKFIGDAVMAVWGAPLAHEDDAERAVRAASRRSSMPSGASGERPRGSG